MKKLKQQVLNEIEELQKETQWWGDENLNNIKIFIQRTSYFEIDTLMTQIERFYNYKDKYLEKVAKF